jgi:uncharacterized protein
MGVQSAHRGVYCALVLLGLAMMQAPMAFPSLAQSSNASKVISPSQVPALETAIFGPAANKRDAAEQELIKLAEGGNLQAKLALGRIYLWGNPIKGKTLEGAALLGSAAQGGNADAATILGSTLLWGLPGLPANKAKAESLLNDAVKSGNTEAANTLGEQLVTGWVLTQDVARGEKILRGLIAKGDSKAMLIVGRCLVWKIGIKGKVATGVEMLERAAAAGQTDASAVLAGTYLWGAPGVTKNIKKAIAHYEKALATGHVNATREYGELLVTGWAEMQDTRRGEELLRGLVKKGDMKAIGVLGRILLNGEGLSKNVDAGVAMLRQAAKSGDIDSKLALGTHLVWGAKSLKERKEAQKLLTDAALGGEKTAWYTLAEGAAYGKLTPEATKLFPTYEREARAAGIDKIEILAAQRSLWGLGVERNQKAAVKHLEKAAAAGNAAAFDYLITMVKADTALPYKTRRERIRSYLKSVAKGLPDSERAQRTVLIEAMFTRSIEGIALLEAEIKAKPFAKSPDFHRLLHQYNENAAMFVVQKALKSSQIYDGDLNGFATDSTILAIRKACKGRMPKLRCTDNVLSPATLALIAVFPDT